MTPQEVFDYKTSWLMSRQYYTITAHSDLFRDCLRWCRDNVSRHKWSYSEYTDVWEHTFYFEEEQTALAFDAWLDTHK
jgi:hypothetical protein